MFNKKSQYIINHNTPIKSNYFAELNSMYLNKIFYFKTFASHKILKYKNKLTMRLYNANNTTKSFWISVSNPVFSFIHSATMYFTQGLIYIFVIPAIRLIMKINNFRAVRNA